MTLCLHCGKIGEHAKGCAQAAPDASDTTPQAKNARALKALEEIQAKLPDIKEKAKSAPRDAAKLIFAVEGIIQAHPSSDLSSFGEKRNYKAAEDVLKNAKTDASAGLEKADQLFSDLAFTKKAIELLHAQTLRRREVASFELGELTKVPELGFDPKENQDPTDPAAVLRAACEAIDRRLAATASVDAEVDAWGRTYLEPLAAGESPREFPSHITGATKMPLAVLGGGLVVALAGAGLALGAGQHAAGGGVGGLGGVVLLAGIVLFMKASSVKRSAPANFAALSQRFRDRLYLVCVLRSLRGILSNLSKAEEAFRTATGGENAARWKRIKTQERDLVTAVTGDWDEGRTVDEEMQKRIQATFANVTESFRPGRELGKEDWDGLAKAYQAERREDAESSDETRLAVLAECVLSSAGQKPESVTARKRAISEARNAFTGRTTARLGK